jgi:hypothetical protein
MRLSEHPYYSEPYGNKQDVAKIVRMTIDSGDKGATTLIAF